MFQNLSATMLRQRIQTLGYTESLSLERNNFNPYTKILEMKFVHYKLLNVYICNASDKEMSVF